jgi:hypothetical protein
MEVQMTDDPSSELERESEPDAIHAAEHVAGAHHLLKSMREKLAGLESQHPELDEAITKLEIALSILTVKTGGML